MITRQFAYRAFWTASSLAFLVCAVALVRDTRYQGQDFEVFWKAAKYLTQAQPLYSLPRDGAMIFKYPPWIATLFIPFSWFSIESAKWIWGAVEVMSLLGVVRWVLAQTKNPLWVVLVTLSFWGVWAVHALDGQISLVILFLALWAEEKGRFTADAAAHIALSTKIFPWLAVIGLGKRAFRMKTLSLAALMVIILSIPALLSEPGHSVVELLKNWKDAAVSGAAVFGEAKIFGRENQGLPALTGRLFPETRAWGETWLFALWALPLYTLWGFVSRRLDRATRFSGWLALAACTHPLAWFHSFVFSFPAASLAVEKSVESKRPALIFASLFGVLAIVAMTAKTAGLMGETLEFYSGKSLGSLICLGVLVLVAPGKHHPKFRR